MNEDGPSWIQLETEVYLLARSLGQPPRKIPAADTRMQINLGRRYRTHTNGHITAISELLLARAHLTAGQLESGPIRSCSDSAATRTAKGRFYLAIARANLAHYYSTGADMRHVR